MKLFSFIAAIIFAGSNFCFASAVYVSSSTGSDINDGLSEDGPLKTIAVALSKADTIFMKSGDVFYEGSLKINGKVLSYYGKGNNPTICGYKRIIEPKWEKAGSNIWKLNLKENNFTGFITNGSSSSNNICAFHDYDQDLLHGRKVWKKREMVDDWDFWQTETLSKAKPEEYDYVYLYLSSDPNSLKLEMSVYDAALNVCQSVIDGVNFVGFGFGISAGTKTHIRNCNLDAIGGRIIPEGESYVCYGNGIEFWIKEGIEDCLVEGCKISRCYDCACTIQGRELCQPTNIRFRSNVIIDCCQAWEDFFTNDHPEAVFKDCVFENNIVVNSGNTSGFGYAKGRVKYSNILENNYLGNKGMIFRNNTFVGGNFFCAAQYDGAFMSNVWQDNTCYIKRGEWLLRCVNKGNEQIIVPKEKGSFKSLKEATDDAIRRYRELTGDETTKFVIVSDKKIDRRINRLKKKHKKQ